MKDDVEAYKWFLLSGAQGNDFGRKGIKEMERDDIVRVNGFTALGITFEGFCRSKGADEEELFLLTKCVPNESNEKFAKYVCKLSGQECSDAFAAFETIARKAEEFFGVTAPATTGDSKTD